MVIDEETTPLWFPPKNQQKKYNLQWFRLKKREKLPFKNEERRLLRLFEDNWWKVSMKMFFGRSCNFRCNLPSKNLGIN